MMRVGDCRRARRTRDAARQRWYAAWRTVRQSKRLLAIPTPTTTAELRRIVARMPSPERAQGEAGRKEENRNDNNG